MSERYDAILAQIRQAYAAANAGALRPSVWRREGANSYCVTEEQLAEQRKRVLVRDIPSRAEFDRRTAYQDHVLDDLTWRLEETNVASDVVHCPTCGEDVPVEEWQIATDDSFAYPKGSAGHGPVESFCVTVPYRGPWWLRALRWVTR